jgi:hypothetical protein
MSVKGCFVVVELVVGGGGIAAGGGGIVAGGGAVLDSEHLVPSHVCPVIQTVVAVVCPVVLFLH